MELAKNTSTAGLESQMLNIGGLHKEALAGSQHETVVVAGIKTAERFLTVIP